MTYFAVCLKDNKKIWHSNPYMTIRGAQNAADKFNEQIDSDQIEYKVMNLDELPKDSIYIPSREL